MHQYLKIYKMVFIYYDGPRRISKARELRRTQKKGLDKQRDDELEEHGFRVFRFTNDQVLYDLERVLTVILKTLQNLPSTGTSPLKHRCGCDFRLQLDDLGDSEYNTKG